jgi:hypothetical protein
MRSRDVRGQCVYRNANSSLRCSWSPSLFTALMGRGFLLFFADSVRYSCETCFSIPSNNLLVANRAAFFCAVLLLL